MAVAVWVVILITVISSVIFFGFGWAASAVFFRKQLNQNPPINEKQIRELYRQAGKTLSESQILKIMNSLKSYKD